MIRAAAAPIWLGREPFVRTVAMPIYHAPLDDIRFVLWELLEAGRLAELPGYEEATADTVDAILEQAGRFAEADLFPLNQPGDEEGCRFDNGVVRTPGGFSEAYGKYVAQGWPGLSAERTYGGQGLPHLVTYATEEIFSAANLSFSVYPGLSKGAYGALLANAADEIKDLYLPKLASGDWTGTMCLTEPQCGTDLGLIRTRAAPAGDGSYRLSGAKIYISAGEHDLAENIVHLVLARLPDAPEGTAGISLFLVPKFLPVAENGGWRPGPRNGVACTGIETKMGLHGGATCTLAFEDAAAWLVGEPHKGMRAMFVMMNAARLHVGLQGLALAEVARQNALDYARERLQGRALAGPARPDLPADPIVVHPDVRRMLLTAKAFTEGARALVLWGAMQMDLALAHPDDDARAEADDLLSLLTPIVKAFCTDWGFDAANLSLQVFGGAGYIRDTGVEQYARDARIAQIYEGANGIQALDLVGRKLGKDMGRLPRRFFHPVAAFLDEIDGDPDLEGLAEPFAAAFEALQEATGLVAERGLEDPDEAAAAATDYLHLFGLVALGYLWLRTIRLAQARLAEGAGDREAFYRAKIATGRFFILRILPQAHARHAAVLAGADTVTGIDEEAL
jgi:alkylation response protein AidB-like acyl-CoA dehydrogenase